MIAVQSYSHELDSGVKEFAVRGARSIGLGEDYFPRDTKKVRVREAARLGAGFVRNMRPDNWKFFTQPVRNLVIKTTVKDGRR